MATIKQNILNSLGFFKKKLNNELYGGEAKSLADLTTTDKSSLTAAINELDRDDYAYVGDLVAAGIDITDQTYLKESDLVDNLTSTSTTRPLTAAQGKVLKEKIGDLDDSKVSKSGDTMSGALIVQTNDNGTSEIWGKSVAIKADNSNYVGISCSSDGQMSLSSSANVIQPNGSSTVDLGSDTVKWKNGYFGDSVISKVGDDYTALRSYGIQVYQKTNPIGAYISLINAKSGTNMNGAVICDEYGQIAFQTPGLALISTGSSGSAYLGTTSMRWKQLYVTTATSVSSDKKIKNHTQYLADDKNLEEFFMNLKPVMYTMKDGDTGRQHMGLYAQDVAENAVNTIGDVSVYEAAKYGADNISDSYYDPSLSDDKLSWSLKYEELIAPIIAIVQKQQRRIEELESIVKGGNLNGRYS